MSDETEESWSPASNPYAIAVSQSLWALWAIQLFAADAREHGGDERSQIYARQIFGQLRALQRCAEMMAKELLRLGVGQSQRDHLQRTMRDFEAAVPGAASARNILEHFDAYARGEGRLVKQAMKDMDIDVYRAAAMYWGGGYDPSTETVTEGPFAVVIPIALDSAEALQRAIYAAGKSADAHRHKS
jgi:hypothetical protein